MNRRVNSFTGLIGILVFILFINIFKSPIVSFGEEKLKTVSKLNLTESQAKEIANNIRDIYCTHLLTFTKDFKEQYVGHYAKKKDLEELFNIGAKDFLRSTRTFGWQEARLLSLEKSKYIVNAQDNTPEGLVKKMTFSEAEADEMLKIVNSAVSDLSNEPMTKEFDGYYIVIVKLFKDDELKRLLANEIVDGCVNCHRLIKGAADKEHLKGALVFKVAKK